MIANLDVIGICGFPGTGKTTFTKLLLELSPDLLIADLDSFVFNARIKRKGEIVDKVGDSYFNDEGALTEETLIKLSNAASGTLTIVHQMISSDVLQDIKELVRIKRGPESRCLILSYTMIPAFNFWVNVDYKVLINTDYYARKKHLQQRGIYTYGEQLPIIDHVINECYQGIEFDMVISNSYNLADFNVMASDLLLKINAQTKI